MFLYYYLIIKKFTLVSAVGTAFGVTVYRAYPHAMDADYWSLIFIGGFGLVAVFVHGKGVRG